MTQYSGLYALGRWATHGLSGTVCVTHAPKMCCKATAQLSPQPANKPPCQWCRLRMSCIPANTVCLQVGVNYTFECKCSIRASQDALLVGSAAGSTPSKLSSQSRIKLTLHIVNKQSRLVDYGMLIWLQCVCVCTCGWNEPWFITSIVAHLLPWAAHDRPCRHYSAAPCHLQTPFFDLSWPWPHPFTTHVVVRYHALPCVRYQTYCDKQWRGTLFQTILGFLA